MCGLQVIVVIKEMASSTMRSIALNYMHYTSPLSKAHVKTLSRLKKRDDIVVTKPDKGSGIVVMNKSEYIRLLSAVSIDNATKFACLMTNAKTFVDAH